jgi:hypothetical protein
MNDALFASGQKAFELAETAGISTKPSSSKFVDKLSQSLKPVPENIDVTRRIISALERLLERSHEDSRLILQISHILHSFSSLDADEYKKKLTRATRYLEKPAATAIVKTLKQASVADLSPKVLEIPDLDTIAVLSQAPRDKVSSPIGSPELLVIGDEIVNVATTSRKDIQAAVRKVKAEARKQDTREEELTDALAVDSAEEVDPLEQTAEDLPEFRLELEEAAQVLNNLLRSLPKKGSLSVLVSRLEETKALLEKTTEKMNQRGERIAPLPTEIHEVH